MSGFFTSPRIAWGPGAIEQLSGLGAHRALLVVDPTVAQRRGHQRIAEELAKSDTIVEVVSDLAEPDRLDSVGRLGERARELSADWLVAVGGGRTLDSVKAARALVERRDVPFTAITPVLELPEPPHVRVAAVPTTSGSGSDASWTVDLFTAEGEPIDLAHRALVPDWSCVDPEFAATLSPDLRIDGALETVAQAVEAYLSAWANPFSDALALDAVATVFERLPHALRWSDDPEAAALLHYAATGAGLAASNSQRGLAHALARALVPATGLAYGRLLGIVLPAVLDFDHPSARERLERLAAVTASRDGTERLPLVARLRRTYDLFRFPSTLRAAGVARERVIPHRESIVARALGSPGTLANPRVPSAHDVEDLVDQIVGG
ncbi:MAG TPA: iron-containing alcohol dehydrogenase [Thermoplasmata archaeon]|nr:iron-containing alcohol dehydrogenase [Thermoplasmata archaeon]